jgi:predicted component of type VI protein secretion system
MGNVSSSALLPSPGNNILADFLPASQLEQVFNSANHSQEQQPPSYVNMEQLRQERIDQIKFVSPTRVYKRPNVPSKLLLNSKAHEIQVRLSEQGKFVQWQEIVYELLEFYSGCQHVGDLGIAQADHLETIGELLRLQRRVDTFIVSYESRVPLITIADAEKLLVTDYNFSVARMNTAAAAAEHRGGTSNVKIDKFEDLFLGPLIKNQLVRRVFHIDDEITSMKQLKAVRASEVLKTLVSYLRENDMWNERVRLADFEAYLCQKSGVKTMRSLGVKISNIGMLIGSLKTVQHLYSESLKTVRQSIDDDFKRLFENEKTWLHKQLLDRLGLYRERFQEGAGGQLVQQYQSSLDYLKMDSIDVVQDLLGLYEKLFDRNDLNNIKPFFNALKNTGFLRGIISSF